MNKRQKIVGILAIVAILAMAAYPPFNLHARGGVIINLGHAWAFNPPENGTIDTALLLTEWVGAVIIAGIASLLFMVRK